jgi:deazaflavin-dependent oxidoreductase (nitroreductase family)
LPIHLYRCNLGWLLGHRFLLLIHRGRRTSRLRQTVLEVIHYDPCSQESIVISAWGEQADWYRNLKESLAVEVRTGRKRYAPAQRFISPQEAYDVLTDYERRNPWAAKVLACMFGHPLASSKERRTFAESAAESMRMVAFRPTATPVSIDPCVSL